MSAETPIPATEDSIFVRRSAYDEDDANLLEASSGSDNDVLTSENDNMEANYREENSSASQFKNLTGASPRVHPRRDSTDAAHNSAAAAAATNQALQTSSKTVEIDSSSKQDNSQTLQNGVEPQTSSSAAAAAVAAQPEGQQPQQNGAWPDQEAYDRALLASGAVDTDEEVDLHAPHGHGTQAAVPSDTLSDEDLGHHLDFEDRGVDLDLDIDSDEEYSGSDEDSSDDDDYGRILQRPCDVRKTAPLGADVTSPKFDGRTSMEFLNAMSPRFAGAEVSSPRPNILPPEARKPGRHKRSVTFNEHTSVLLGNGETQLQPLIDDEDDEDEWNGHEFGEEHEYAVDNDGGHLLQSSFPTIQVGDLESPRSDDDYKKHSDIPVQDYISAIETLEKRMRLAADKLDAARAERENLTAKLREEHDAFLDQQNIIGDMQEELETLRDNFNKVSHLCDEATDEKQSAMQEIETQKKLMSVQDSTIERLRSTMDMKSEKLCQIEETQKAELERVRSKLTQENKELRERNRRLSKENNSLRAQLQSVIKKTRADRDAYARVRVSLAKQAQAAKLHSAQARASRPRSEWDAQNSQDAQNSTTKPAHYSRRYRQAPSQQPQKASAIWSVLVPTAIIAVGFLARTLSANS